MRRVVVSALFCVALSAAILAYALRRDAPAGLEGFLSGVLLILTLEGAVLRWLRTISKEPR